MRNRKEIEKLWSFVEGNLKLDEIELFILFVKKKLQKQEVARLLGIDRSTFTYRLDRCIKKLRYEYLVTKLLPQIEEVLPDEYFKTLVLYLQSRNQEQVGVQLKITQSAVSQRLTKIKSKLSKMKNRDIREFAQILNLRFNFWGWPNEKKLFSNARIVEE